MATAFREVIDDQRSLDQVTAYWIKQNRGWSTQDKGFFAETLMECVRWWRLLHTISNRVTPHQRGFYWGMLQIYQYLFGAGGSADRNFEAKIRAEYERIRGNRAIRESIPDWMDTLCTDEIGEDWDAEMASLNRIPPMVLRVNRLKIERDELQSRLWDEGIETRTLDSPDALILKGRAPVFGTKAFHQGLFELQDHSSQQVAPFLQVEAGMRVIDACAGNGGKTLHLASLMGNKGKIVALDVAEWKLQELLRRAKRAGVSMVEARPIASLKTVKRLKESADRLLLDVPCSGLGVLRRNPDSKWRLSHSKMEELRRVQGEILTKYSPLVRPGGKIVYSTCSILPSENGRQVRVFLGQSNGQYVLEEEKAISPAQSGFDGFYMARIRREG
jgi:16S rRNA (cytosine967-C5)-methyltransferase